MSFTYSFRPWPCIWLIFLIGAEAFAQSALPFTPISLDDLKEFRPAAANWRIGGDAVADRNKDQSMQATAGKGVLINLPTDKLKDQLFTSFEHGNVELELEFMMAKGANSGVYLQGRYEIQLFDSWGVAQPHHSDCGGIYERWNESLPKDKRGFGGHPPRVNVSRAPGLWQTMKIVFQAPKFDPNGKKIANARFVKVVQNGVLLHENVEVSGPTRAAAFTDEKPTGPLMLQGDHGPVAFRNIRYKRYDQSPVQLSNLQYKYFEGKFAKLADIAPAKPKKQGKVEENAQLVESANDFALQLDGTLQVPSNGNYLFELQCLGGVQLTIDGKDVITYDGFHYGEEWASGQTTLQAGTHPFTLRYFRSNVPWIRSMLVLYSEGPGIARHLVPLPTSLPEPEYIEPILVEATQPTIQRSFVQHHGKKKTLGISVGEPGGIHYTVDAGQGTLLQIWKGGFLNATEMWHERGEPQLAFPAGSAIQLSGEPTLAVLSSTDAIWPDSVNMDDAFQLKGYSVDAQGHPTFRYLTRGLEVRDQTLPDPTKRMLTRQLQIKGTTGDNLWCLIATGDRIVQLPDGAYTVDNKSYYVEIDKANGSKPVVRKSKNREELLIPVKLSNNQGRLEGNVKYNLIW